LQQRQMNCRNACRSLAGAHERHRRSARPSPRLCKQGLRPASPRHQRGRWFEPQPSWLTLTPCPHRMCLPASRPDVPSGCCVPGVSQRGTSSWWGKRRCPPSDTVKWLVSRALVTLSVPSSAHGLLTGEQPGDPLGRIVVQAGRRWLWVSSRLLMFACPS
jgi:hypothetical protein